ncbi:MAG: FkbM family methyltransferase [Pseudomonadota bacterium]
MTRRKQPPFGAYKPSSFQELVRTLAAKLPDRPLSRKLASLLLGPAGGRAKRGYDVSVFGDQRARLHPFDNICEKRVYLTPQFWDPAERSALSGLIAQMSARNQDTIRIVDVGANAGLYTLFLRSVCKAHGMEPSVIAIEPDPEMRARLEFNLEASDAADDTRIIGLAASDQSGALRFTVNKTSRGMSKVDADGQTTVAAAPLLEILNHHQDFQKIDILKIDIEGHEAPVLSTFFAEAPDHIMPQHILTEVSHDAQEKPLVTMISEHGYKVVLETPLNALLTRTDG